MNNYGVLAIDLANVESAESAGHP